MESPTKMSEAAGAQNLQKPSKIEPQIEVVRRTQLIYTVKVRGGNIRKTWSIQSIFSNGTDYIVTQCL